ncbi:hypothetical protein AAIB41_07400 [Brucella sp. BE17]|uniref:hypothetical protein n=1 Tax=Brucella sp. BE17 TaxID=3142977 RepID=UPI0031BBCCD0
MKWRSFAFGLMLFIAFPAQADQLTDFNADLGKVVGAFNAAQLYAEQCDMKYPSSKSERRDVLAGWSYANSKSNYDRLMKGIQARIPDIAVQISRERDKLAGVIAKEIAKSPQQCDDLMKVFKEDSQFSVERPVRRLIVSASKLGIDIADAPEIVPKQKSADEISILRIAALSARLEAKMAEIGSKEGARRYRELSSARESHARDWLIADGMQLLYGRVTKDDELREWRDDQQSSFKVECDTFVSDEHKAKMVQAVGQERVVLGTPRSIHDTRKGGKLTLRKCSVFTIEETGRPFLDENDVAGLMPRPMEESEAYAGPNQGINLNSVDRVLYEASFDNRLDGFGNGYIDRQEAIYILLSDGSAYHHEWSFPFTDLAVNRSKEREPERWFTWEETDGAITLTHTGGEAKGSTFQLKKPQKLRPMSMQNLKARYYYLQVGMGGHRQDRSYVFSDDGRLTYHRSGFVAGNVATSYIIVNGSNDKNVKANYRFEDFALMLERDGEIERHFLAVPDSADEALPDTLIIRGTAYWLDKK